MMDSGLDLAKAMSRNSRKKGLRVHQKVCWSLRGIQDTKNNMITLTEREQTRKELRLRRVG